MVSARLISDMGEPLGSQSNPECQIDSLPQSWSVISGAGDPARSRQALQSVDQRLVRREAGLIQLFDPPFDKSALNPGYIKGYHSGACARTAANTRTARFGRPWPSHSWVKTNAPGNSLPMVNPIHHGGTPRQIATYKVEALCVAADVYPVLRTLGGAAGRGITGSAGWMYRLLIETLLGVNLEGDQVRYPRLPKSVADLQIHYRYRQTVYHITITHSR